jgi:hypothetical protein
VSLHVFTLAYAYKAHPSYAFMDDAQSVRTIQVSETSPSPMTPISKEQTDISTRAKYIRNLIEKNKHWTGCHSPIPCRATTEDTFKSVRKEISVEDSAALMIVLQDDAGEIRYMGSRLLGCINPNARSEIEKLMVAETSIERQSRFEEALIIIDEIRAGRTDCE